MGLPQRDPVCNRRIQAEYRLARARFLARFGDASVRTPAPPRRREVGWETSAADAVLFRSRRRHPPFAGSRPQFRKWGVSGRS